MGLVIPILIILVVVWIFNPYVGWKWRTNEELWKTREASFGWPFYWKMQNDPEAKRKNYSCLTNSPCKVERVVKNIIYIE